jgi:hypothetical protein
MEFGDQKSPNTASFIPDRTEEDDSLRIAHLSGLGCSKGASVVIDMTGGKLVFESEREVQDKSYGFPVSKMEKYIEEVMLTDVQAIDITDESGRSLGKTVLYGAIGLVTLGALGLIGGALLGGRKQHKYFVIIQVKPENKLPYSITLGLEGKSHKKIISYYENLMGMIHADYYKGVAKGELGDYIGAIQDYNKAIELNPNHADAYYNRGLAKIKLGQKDSGCLDPSKAGELGLSQAYDSIKQYCQ